MLALLLVIRSRRESGLLRALNPLALCMPSRYELTVNHTGNGIICGFEFVI